MEAKRRGAPYSASEFLLDLYSGVDHSLPGNGGLECYQYLSFSQRIADTLLYTLILTLFVVPQLRKRLTLPPKDALYVETAAQRRAKNIFLIALCVTFGVEIGYKISTRQIIYLLNPCHVLSVVQIYLLSSEPCRRTHIVFRVHVHLLFGAFLAVILPVVNARTLPGEVAIYWIQHILILFVIPPYLMSCGSCYTPELLQDFTWPLASLFFFACHMYYVLQGVGMLTLVNLNNMLCPAISDPFYGPNYRWFAMVHQTLLVIFFGKVYTYIVQVAITLVQALTVLKKTQ